MSTSRGGSAREGAGGARAASAGASAEVRRLLRFGLVGLTGIAVNLGAFVLARGALGRLLGPTAALLPSSLLGDELSILWCFALHSRWTFRGTGHVGGPTVGLLRFHAVTLTSVVLSNAVLLLLIQRAGLPATASKLAGIVAAFLWNYWANARWTWSPAPRSGAKAGLPPEAPPPPEGPR